MTSSTIEERDGARIHDIKVAGSDAYLVEPIDGGRGAAIVFLHWYDTDAPDGNRTQFVDEAVDLARERGVVSFLPQAQFPGASEPSDAQADTERIAADVERHRAGVDLLADRSDVEVGRIALVGHDFGAMRGIILATSEPRIAAAILIAFTPRWGDWFLPFFTISGDRYDYLRALGPLDPVNRIGEIAPRPVWLQFARNDFYVAPMSGWELNRAAGDPKEMHAYETDHSMRDAEARSDRARFLASALRLTDA